ncbi:hypothetical protein [Pseudomonas sp. NPDC089406]|uniref:hypothetical protein n=1 Tax=Pseudomonas sp. NPDC089406 TaxID=3364463 RepID=UPI00384F5FD3
MPNNNIYLEARKSDGAILSYFIECPETVSTTVDYVQATQDELTYLSALEDHVFPAGTVASLDDLYAHRKRVQEAKATKAAQDIETARNIAQKLSKSVSKPTNSNVYKEDSPIKASVKEFLRKYQANKRR